MPTLRDIMISEVEISPQARQRLETDTEAQTALASSIQANGLINPIVVQVDGDHYRLAAGTRRLAACKQLDLARIKANVYDRDENLPRALSLAENLVRSDLTPIEEAAAVAELLEDENTRPEILARSLGRTTDWINSRIELLDYPEQLQLAVHHQGISLGVARELARIDDEAQREFYLRAAIDHGCTVRQAIAWRLNYQTNRPPPERPQDIEPHHPEHIAPPVLVEPCFCCRTVQPTSNLARYPLCPHCARAINQPPPPPGPPTP